MAGLRDYGINVNSATDADRALADRQDAAGLTQFGRGLRAGSLGAEANYLAAQEVEARAAGDIATAEKLRGQGAGLRTRAATFSPRLQRVEDVGGAGDALDYALGTAGQAIASTQDPMLGGAVGGAVGGLASLTPIGRGIRGLRGGAAALGAFAPAYRQSKGEAYTNMLADPVAAQLDPAEQERQASLYGLGSGALESVVPAALGARGLGRLAALKLPTKGIPGGLVGAGLTEGATELAQGELGRQQIGLLNPNRDTSGDASARLNDFAGGVIGGAGMHAPSSVLGATTKVATEGVKDAAYKAGDVLGLDDPESFTNRTIDSAKQGAKSARAKVETLGKAVQERAPEVKKGADEILNRLRTAGQNVADEARATYEVASEGADLLDGSFETKVPEQLKGDPKLVDVWLRDKRAESAAAVTGRLNAIAAGDQPERAATARQLLQSGDIEGARPFVAGEGRFARAREVVSQVAGGLAARVEGKFNSQAADAPLTYRAWSDLRSPGPERPRTPQETRDRAAQMELTAEIQTRAELAARYMASAVPKDLQQVPGIQRTVSALAYQLSEAQQRGERFGTPDRNAQLNKTLERVVAVYGNDAPAAVDEALRIFGQTNRKDKVASYVRDEVRALLTPEGVQAAKARRDQQASEMVDALGPEAELALSKQGVNLRSPAGRAELLGLVERFAESGTPAQRKELESVFGAEATQRMLEVIQPPERDTTAEEAAARAAGKVKGDGAEGDIELSDEAVSDEEGAAFDARQAAKTSDRRRGEPTYVFRDGNSTSRSVQSRVFDDTRRTIGGDEQFFDYGPDKKPVAGSGRSALQQRLRETFDKVNPKGKDGQRTERNMVEPVPALQFFKDEGVTAREVLQAYKARVSDNQRQRVDAALQLLDRGNLSAEEKAVVNKTKRDAYDAFQDQYVVRVTPMSDPEALQFKLGDVKALEKGARKALENSRLAVADGKTPQQAESEANILYFQSKNAAAKDGRLAVRAGDLVNFVRRARGEGEVNTDGETERTPATNAAYLNDLSIGISTLLDSGLVEEQLPYKVNAAGQRESFDKGIPDSLRLVTTTAGGMKKGRELRAGTRRPNPDRNEYELEEPAEINTDEVDQPQAARPVGEIDPEDPSASRTELDRRGERKDSAEFIGQRVLTNQQLRSPSGEFTLSRINAAGGASVVYADWLQNRLGDSDPDVQREGVERVEQLLKAAARPAGDQRRASDGKFNPGFLPASPWLVGPVVELTAPARMNKLAKDEPMREQMASWRKAAAAALRNAPEGSITPAVKRDLVKRMAANPRVVTTENMDALLDRLLGVEAVTPKQEPAAPEVAAEAPGKSQPEAAGPRSSEAAGPRNAQTGPSQRVASQEEMDAAAAYVSKVLGPQVQVEFKDITGYAGEWIEARNVIEISTTAAPGAMQVAYHEAMHAFWSKFVAAHPELKDVLAGVAGGPMVLRQLERLLASYPQALAQLSSAEERVAYAYQFWAAGLLNPGGRAAGLFGKVKAFFKRVLGLTSDAERAQEIFELFHAGKLAEPSAAGQAIHAALNRGTWTRGARRRFDKQLQKLAGLALPTHDVLLNLESPTAKKLAQMLYVQPGASQDSTEEGYLNARKRVTSRYINLVSEVIGDLDDAERAEVIKHLQAKTDSAYAPVQNAVQRARQLLDNFYNYATEAGVKLRKVERYFPRVWDPQVLFQKKDEFIALMAGKYAPQLREMATYLTDGAYDPEKTSNEDLAHLLWQSLVDNGGVEDKLQASREDGILEPWMEAKQERSLTWLKAEDVEPFLDKNLVGTLTRYFRQGVRAAEYQRRFGERGALLKQDVEQIRQELREEAARRFNVQLPVPVTLPTGKVFVPEDPPQVTAFVAPRMANVHNSLGAIEGTLGKDISPGLRKLNSYAIVYQNLRLLPLALFSSVVDPLGILARGGELQDAYDAFVRGMTGVMNGWRQLAGKDRKGSPDEFEKLAELVGIVDDQHFLDSISDAYASEYLDERARKVNNTLFSVNGMEAWNRSMRIGATAAAVKFIERHAGQPGKDSERWLRELGLDPKAVPLVSGRLATTAQGLAAAKGIPLDQARKELAPVHVALARWVDGAVLAPNAAQRPAWGSDPHYATFFHLKQFTYSFHQTILRRAVREAGEGNLGPIAAFSWYVPVMIAADITKGLIQGGGELPAYMKGYDVGDWVMHGVQRAGLMGVGQMAVDAEGDVFGVFGPTVEQVTDAVADPADKTLVRALPANALYRGALE